MERFDIVVIGAGAGGEAATHLAARRGAKVAVVDRDLFGGGCPYWQCMPSKALLHAAAVHYGGGGYDWPQASEFRDYMINRQGTDYPDDGGHVRSLEEAGATVLRGTARFIGPGQVVVEHEATRHELAATNVIVAIGSRARIPDLPGLAEIDYWTNRQGTGTRELPRSLVVLGGGPTGIELAQVYARYGVPTVIVHPKDRINDRDHPRNSAALAEALIGEGVTIRTGVRAERIRPGDGGEEAHEVVLSDGSSVSGHAILVAIGRAVPFDDLNLAAIGVETRDGRVKTDARLRIAPDVYLIGDAAGPELHTHVAHYQGEMAARLALGDDVAPDLHAIPRATYTDPETASVGLLVEQARERGIDAFEVSLDLATTAKGYVAEAKGHVTVVVDRGAGVLVGAFLAGPGVSETIHEAVLAVKARTPIAVLADTIHAFPTVARVLGTAFAEAADQLQRG